MTKKPQNIRIAGRFMNYMRYGSIEQKFLIMLSTIILNINLYKLCKTFTLLSDWIFPIIIFHDFFRSFCSSLHKSKIFAKKNNIFWLSVTYGTYVIFSWISLLFCYVVYLFKIEKKLRLKYRKLYRIIYNFFFIVCCWLKHLAYWKIEQ